MSDPQSITSSPSAVQGFSTDCELRGMAATEAERASSIVSRMAFGFPGRFKMRALPRKPAVCLDSTAVGTTLRQAQHDQTLSEAGRMPEITACLYVSHGATANFTLTQIKRRVSVQA